MTDFQGFVCWHESDVEPVLAPVVEAAGEAAFLATHLSLPIEPEVSRHHGHKDYVTEFEILREFQALERDPGIMAVTGPSGSGKSHLIRWLYANLAGNDNSHVLYVPREDTSLQVVLRRILEDLPGEAARDLLADIKSSTDRWSRQPQLAVANVLDMIGNSLEYDPPASNTRRDPARVAALTGVSDGRTVGPPGLAHLLRHESVRKALLDADGVVAGNVHAALGQDRDASGPPRRFTADEIVVLLRSAAGRLPTAARKVTNLLSPTGELGEGWRDVAADLMNECLDDAVGSLIGLDSSVSLVEVMSRARQILKQDGRELILLIEDFALFDRIGGSLIDALVTPSGEDRCRLRTAFAITDDPYHRLAETLRRRVGLHFRTGVLFDASDGSAMASTAVDLVGGYLNAVRLGHQRLKDEFRHAREEHRLGEPWVPSACVDCPHLAACHDPAAFGESTDDYGLYPLNRPSVLRLASAALEGGRLVPRTLLTQVLAPLLETDPEDLRHGRFPSPAFEGRARRLQNGRSAIPIAPAEISEDLDTRQDPDAERRIRTLELWKPGHLVDLCNISPTIHEAFQLPTLEEIPVSTRPAIPEVQHTIAEQTRQPAREGLARDLADLDRWAVDDDASISTHLTRQLQTTLYDMVRSHISWNDYLLSPNLEGLNAGTVFTRESFDLDRGTGARNPPSGSLRWPIPADTKSAVLLKAVLRFRESRTFESGREYDIVQSHVSRWAAEVLRRCQESGYPIEPAIQCLIACAWIDGTASDEAFTQPYEAVLAALTPTGPSEPIPTDLPFWTELANAATSPDREQVRQRLLQRVQAAQGVGAVLAADLTALTAPAERFLRHLAFDSPPPGADLELRGLYATLNRFFTPAVIGAQDELTDLHDLINWDVVDAHTEVAAKLLTVSLVASREGVFEPGEKLGPFQRDCERFGDLDIPAELQPLRVSAAAIAESGSRMNPLAVRTGMTAVARGKVIAGFLDEASTYLHASSQEADHQLSQHFADETPEAALDRLRGILEDLTENVSRLRGAS